MQEMNSLGKEELEIEEWRKQKVIDYYDKQKEKIEYGSEHKRRHRHEVIRDQAIDHIKKTNNKVQSTQFATLI